MSTSDKYLRTIQRKHEINTIPLTAIPNSFSEV